MADAEADVAVVKRGRDEDEQPSELRKPKLEEDDKGTGKRWTAEQDEALKKAVEEFGQRNWKSIATRVPGRNHAQCLQRWNKVLKPGLVKGHWSYEEDSILERMVLQGCHSWSEVSASIPGRTAKQCRERWRNHLDPSINKSPFTPEEDMRIQQAYEHLGNRWTQIAELLPGRTEDAVKMRWKALNPNLKTNAKPGRPRLMPGLVISQVRNLPTPCNTDELAMPSMPMAPAPMFSSTQDRRYDEYVQSPGHGSHPMPINYVTPITHMIPDTLSQSGPPPMLDPRQDYIRENEYVPNNERNYDPYDPSHESNYEQYDPSNDRVYDRDHEYDPANDRIYAQDDHQTDYADEHGREYIQEQGQEQDHQAHNQDHDQEQQQEQEQERDQDQDPDRSEEAARDAAMLKSLLLSRGSGLRSSLRNSGNLLMSIGNSSVLSSLQDMSPDELLASGELDELLRAVSIVNEEHAGGLDALTSQRLSELSRNRESLSRALSSMDRRDRHLVQGIMDELRSTSNAAVDIPRPRSSSNGNGNANANANGNGDVAPTKRYPRMNTHAMAAMTASGGEPSLFYHHRVRGAGSSTNVNNATGNAQAIIAAVDDTTDIDDILQSGLMQPIRKGRRM